MSDSYASVVLHLVFSTKNRAPVLSAGLSKQLYGYMAGTVRNKGCDCYRVGGAVDHVHLSVGLSRTVTIAGLVETVKASSSRWIHGRAAEFSEFAWQGGYGAFSVSKSDLPALNAYIEDQPLRHRTMTFQEEFLEILEQFGVPYDPVRIWE